MRNKMIACALDFASFLLESGVEPRRVILFGSVAAGEMDKESDIDIFIDIDEPEEKKIRGILRIFEGVSGEKWRLKGVNNPLSLKIGSLKRWPELKRSIQSYSILLYGKYIESPESMKSYLMFRLDFSGLKRAKKVKAWRTLYGYSQKIGRKEYRKRGIIEGFGGKKLENSIVIVPSDKSKKFKEFLNKSRVNFLVNEIWSDNL